MENVWLIKVRFSDEATYSNFEVKGVCTSELEAIQLEGEIREKYPTYDIEIEEVKTNKYLD